MSEKQAWGRKETIVWPPHAPVFVFGGFGVAVLLALVCCWSYLRFWQTPMQQTYTVMYAETSIGALFKQTGTYRLVYVAGAKVRPHLAVPLDFTAGETELEGGRKVPVQLSETSKREGNSVFFTGAPKKYADVNLSRWLRQLYFKESFSTLYRPPLLLALAVFCITLPFLAYGDVRRFKRLKYGRRLKGPEMLAPVSFNKALKSDGLTIRTMQKHFLTRKSTELCIPKSVEAKHIQIMGDTGSGKTTLLMQFLQQIAERGETAIVYDTAGEFTERFYREGRGDWILNPLDERTPYWTPSSELQNPAEARTIATSMYQPRDDKRGEFFTDTPQKIFAHLLKYRPTPDQLVEWMSNDQEIDRRLKGTELANFAPKDAPQQRSGVLGSLGLVADSLRLLPTKDEASGREWCATEWAEKREGWIFFTSTKATREALRPLQSLWIDLLVLRLLTKPKPGQKKVWLVIDELASLQRLPQFHTALTEGRKSENPIVFAYQGKAQLETVYGHLAEVMLSMPNTKFILRTSEPNAAEWASRLIGKVEIERVRETVADGKRQGKSFTLDRQIEPLVMESEIEGLSDLHTFVKINNYVSRFAFPHMTLPVIAASLKPRAIPESKMWFDPLAPVEPEVPAETEGATKEEEAVPEKEPALLKESPNVWMKEPEEEAKPGDKPKAKPSSKGAPLKEAEALVPAPKAPKPKTEKPKVPKVVLSPPTPKPPSMTHEM